MKSAKSIIIAGFCWLIVGIGNVAFGATNNRQIPITGKVLDSRNNKGIGHVDISFIGTNIGTVSNADGNFSLYCPDEKGGKISFSTKGYSTITIPLDSLRRGFR